MGGAPDFSGRAHYPGEMGYSPFGDASRDEDSDDPLIAINPR
jgi:hypothetical protein